MNLIEQLKDYQILPEGGRAAYYLFNNLVMKQYATDIVGWPLDGVNVMSSSRRHNAKWFRMHQDHSRYERELARFISNSKLLDQLNTETAAYTDEVIKIFSQIDWKTITNDELIKQFQFFCNQYVKILRPSAVIRLLDLAIIPRLRSLWGKDNADNLIRKISVPSQPSYVQREEVALLKLAIKVPLLSASESDSFLEEIKSEYAWSGLGYFNEKAKTLNDYQQRLNDYLSDDPVAKLREIESKQKELISERDRIISSCDSETKVVARIAYESTQTKDFFKYSINKATYSSWPMFEEIASRTGKPISDIYDLSIEEVTKLLRKEAIDEKIVKSRTNFYVISVFQGELRVFWGEEAGMIEKEYLMPKEMSDEFRGRVASVGYAKGRAKVILNPDQFAKMEVGDILVVANTSPDFTVIMRKAAAIVAEEGGLTAHVSVVSREMKIPAVVGIHYATSMIKDGDLVEVDADKGIVKIIK